MLAYCTKEDALAWVTPGSVTPQKRSIACVRPAADSFELEDHRLEAGHTVQLWLYDGTGEMPAPLVEGQLYYAIVLSERTFQLAATPADALAGTQIDITTEGDTVRLIAEIPWATIINRNSVYLGSKMTGNAFPLADDAEIPPAVRRLCSLLSLAEAALFVGKTDLDVEKHLDRAWRELDEQWEKGKRLRDGAPPATMTAVSGPRVSGSAGDGRGWSRINCSGREVIG